MASPIQDIQHPLNLYLLNYKVVEFFAEDRVVENIEYFAAFSRSGLMLIYSETFLRSASAPKYAHNFERHFDLGNNVCVMKIRFIK